MSTEREPTFSGPATPADTAQPPSFADGVAPADDAPQVSFLQKLAGRIFGFDQEIALLREQVNQLRWDTAYGMWTRGAFLQFCQIMPRSTRMVVFIDFNDIHRLNNQVGYADVDRRIRNTFSVPFRRSDVVARWYSGDEIVILFDSNREGAEGKLGELTHWARKEGLSFKYALGEWEVGKQTAEDVIGALGDEVAKQKLASRD